MILALVGYQFDKCKVVFSLVVWSFSWNYLVPRRLKYLLFFTKFSNGKTLGGISVLGFDRYCYKVSAAANHMKFGGVFTAGMWCH